MSKSTKVALPNGKWFDRQECQEWEECTHFDGHNQISNATGSQWNHESLLRTKMGTWIIHSWSQYQGISESYRVITGDAAVIWLVSNGIEIPEELKYTSLNSEV